ncbi:hypothetical protein HK105_202009 [Polyrhizophydium stewartii]|uniref:Rubisco LSMT substrate-binding domain-containing protein n=1 Tax=Polyrhizophydium stewartii TaxID=2732419 RepID=A0ABR4NGF5_9FUNG
MPGAPAKAEVEPLLDWGRRHGARVDNLDIRHESLDDDRNLSRGVYANRDVGPGDEICFIPETILLSESVVRASAIGKAVLDYIAEHPEEQALVNDPVKHPHAGILLAMAAFMVHEYTATEGHSHWMPYLASLPGDYTLPLMWPRERVAHLLGGTPLEHMIFERLDWIEAGTRTVERACGDRFPPGALTTRSLLWAACAVWSRAFPKARPVSLEPPASPTHKASAESGQDWISLSEICLYPILDMLNHKRGHKIEWKMSSDGVAFVAVDGTARGSELLNNYGPKGNENLLSNYGFVLQGNPEDYVKVFLALRSEDALYAAKQEIVGKIDGCSFVHLIFRGDELPAGLVSVARILVANELDLHLLHERAAKAIDGYASVHTSPVSARNELLALSTLHSLLLGKLSAVQRNTPDYERDECEYPTDSEPRRLARVYRDGQEAILQHALAAAHSHLLDQRANRVRFSLMAQNAVDEMAEVAAIASLAEFLSHGSISAESEHMDPEMAEFVAAVCQLGAEGDDDGDGDGNGDADEEPIFDEDTLLVLIVANETKIGRKSHWAADLAALASQDGVHEQLLGDRIADMESHFEEEVQPLLRGLLKQRPGTAVRRIAKRLDDKRAFVSAAAIVELCTVTLDGQWIDPQAGPGTEPRTVTVVARTIDGVRAATGAAE